MWYIFYTSVAEQIEHSKLHWSTLAESNSEAEDEEVAEMSNVEAFEALQSHPTWGGFFYKFNQGDGSTLQVGEKFANGGQAELFHAQVTWWNPEVNGWFLEHGTEWALKVFKKGTFLRRLQAQLPHGLLQFRAQERKRWKSPTTTDLPRFYCEVYRGTLLEDGRFAFLLQKEHVDLRNLIECYMKLRSGKKDCGPFSKEEGEFIMYEVPLGVDWLHNLDIVHRDLKASNVLVHAYESGYPKFCCYVADYECSIGVVGTGFFRAPEILQALKEQKLRQRPEVFSKAADIYRYGMTCYEILTGKLPFEDHSINDYDLVLNGHRPVVPEYVEDWTCELLTRCWQFDPQVRPAFGEILDILLANSAEARRYEECLKRRFGENFRIRHHTQIRLMRNAWNAMPMYHV